MDEEKRLGSWKEIGAYLERDARTARRWEKEEGLPVHRHSHKSRASVYAYPSEIDAWRAGRKVVPEAVARPLWKMPAFAVTLALCLVMVGNGIRPQRAEAQAAAQATKRIWSGEGVGHSVSVSRDGRHLSFIDLSGGLAVRDLVTGQNRLLAGAQIGREAALQSAISPDGRQVAYTWFTGSSQSYDMRVLPMDAPQGAEPRILLRNQFVFPYAWSSDEKQIVAVRQDETTAQIVLVSVPDGSLSVVKSLPWGLPELVSLSPDGRWLAYDDSPSLGAPHDIFLLAVDGSREAVAVEGPVADYAPLWTPDGSRLLFMSTRSGTPALWTLPVKDGKPAGTPERITEVGAPIGLNASGTLFFRRGDRQQDVYFAALDGSLKATGEPVAAGKRFIGSNFRGAWSPDGKYFAYFSQRERADYPTRLQSYMIVVQTVASGAERDVPLDFGVSAGDFAAPPQWFPDGRFVLAVSSEPGKPGHGYYKVSLENGRAELLHRSTGQARGPAHPRLSADGKRIIYIDSDGDVPQARLMQFDIAARRESQLKHAAAGQTFASVAMSPDGEQLAYLSSDERAQSTALEAMPVAGGPARELFRAAPWIGSARFGVLSWTPDQRNLLFVKPASGTIQELWSIPAAGGQPEKTGISNDGAIKSPEVSPDGRRIAFSANKRAAPEVWTLENFLPAVSGK